MMGAYNFNMTNCKYTLQIQSHLENVDKSFHGIDHYLSIGDNGQARLEMQYILPLINELNDKLSILEHIGRQPEEILIANNNTQNYYDHILVIFK